MCVQDFFGPTFCQSEGLFFLAHITTISATASETTGTITVTM